MGLCCFVYDDEFVVSMLILGKGITVRVTWRSRQRERSVNLRYKLLAEMKAFAGGRVL